ncbi:MAG: hypothetical protein HF978_00930 [Desulfobacteraceae bacterium]|nr:hypothetical protein [Desulfobacteraceae bacterium]MBC2754095.1 hypothetical protein [Desulfobacteraceae bacterium]
MNVIHTDLFTVIKRFPDRKVALKTFFDKSENFQVICQDYRRCFEALNHWKRSDREEAAITKEEYKALLKELEAEIIQMLNKNMPL